MEDGIPDVPTLTLHKNLCLLLNLCLSKFASDVKLFWHTSQVDIFLREFRQLLVCARSGLARDILCRDNIAALRRTGITYTIVHCHMINDCARDREVLVLASRDTLVLVCSIISVLHQ